MNKPTQFTPNGRNPFAPGAGLTPPYLAGRDEQLAFFKSGLKDMKAFQRGLAVVVYAPRGMGKTVLMERLRDDLAKSDVDTTFVVTRPDREREIPMSDLEQLLSTVASPADEKTVKKHGGISAGVHAEVSTTETWKSSGQDRRVLFERHLKQSCAERPAVLVIDEAHRLQDGDRIELLNMAQEVTKRGQFLFILAGTPSLIQSIAKGATFADRFEVISLRMLGEAAAATALREPLEKGGIAIESEPLRYVAAQAHGYPYFIQLWGRALWDYSTEHGIQRLTDAHARTVEAAVNAKRADYYNSRFKEMSKNRELHVCAAVVADAYNVADQYDEYGMSQIINLALKRRVADADARWEKAESLLDELVSLGYIWKPAGQLILEVGIPSLMDYIRQRRPKQLPPLSPTEAKRVSQESRERQSGPL